MVPASHVFTLLAFYLCCPTSLADGSIKVIGAGFGRTGTKSLKAALNELGYKTYHFSDMFFNKTHSEIWGTLWNNGSTVDDALNLLTENGYDAGVDWPLSLLWVEVLDRHPDAKVILSLRRNPEVWATSFMESTAVMGKWMSQTPLNLIFPGVGPAILWTFSAVGMDLHPEEMVPIRESAVQAYKKWKKTVMQNCPEEKLLVWKPEEGWKPLCEFLQIGDCPTTPFPKMSWDRLDLQRLHTVGTFIEAWWKALGVIFLILFNILLVCCHSYFSSRAEKKTEQAAKDTPTGTPTSKKED